MKLKKVSILPLLFLAFSFTVQSQTTWETLTTEWYTIKYPSDWLFKKVSDHNFSLTDKDQNPSFYVGFEIINYGRSLEDYEQDVPDHCGLDHISSLTREQVMKGNTKFVHLVLTGTSDHPQEKLRIDEKFTFYNKRLIIISACYNDDDHAKDFGKTIQHFFDSLQLNL